MKWSLMICMWGDDERRAFIEMYTICPGKLSQASSASLYITQQPFRLCWIQFCTPRIATFKRNLTLLTTNLIPVLYNFFRNFNLYEIIWEFSDDDFSATRSTIIPAESMPKACAFIFHYIFALGIFLPVLSFCFPFISSLCTFWLRITYTHQPSRFIFTIRNWISRIRQQFIWKKILFVLFLGDGYFYFYF